MFQIPTLEPKKHKKSVLYLTKDYNFSFFRNVYLEFFIQDFYQHLTELGQVNCLDKTFSSFPINYRINLIWRYADEIKTFKDLKNTCKIKCLFIFICAVHQCGATLFKKTLWHRCFPVNFVKFPRTPFLTEHFQWLSLSIRSFKMQIDFCFWHSTKTFLLIFVLSFLSSSLKEEL